jgi:hypothetical protein
MKLFVFLIQFIFLSVEINCLKIISCIHNYTIYSSLQDNPKKVECEADETPLGCTLRQSDSANKYCQYLYGVGWRWNRNDCPPETISSNWKSYKICQFVISNPSVAGTA